MCDFFFFLRRIECLFFGYLNNGAGFKKFANPFLVLFRPYCYLYPSCYSYYYYHYYFFCNFPCLLTLLMLLCAFVWGVLGKTLDRSCPMGPSIVIADGTYSMYSTYGQHVPYVHFA